MPASPVAAAAAAAASAASGELLAEGVLRCANRFATMKNNDRPAMNLFISLLLTDFPARVNAISGAGVTTPPSRRMGTTADYADGTDRNEGKTRFLFYPVSKIRNCLRLTDSARQGSSLAA